MLGFLLRLLIAAACAFVFIFAGVNKLTDQVDADMHAKMVAGSQTWTPLINSQLSELLPDANVVLQPTQLRLFIGAAEVVGALLLLAGAFAPGLLSVLANLGLLATMGGAIWVHQTLNEPVTVPSALAGLLGLFLVLQLSACLGGGSSQRKKKTA